MELIPAIDLRGGGVVRLYQGDFAAETRYQQTPLELLARYEAAGARWLHVVDLDGARDGAARQSALVGSLARAGHLRLQAGGGVGDEATLARLLDEGVARVVVGSAALNDPDGVLGWLERHGPERLALALDVAPPDAHTTTPPIVLTHGWQRSSGRSLWDVLAPFAAAGLRHVLCTDVERDGAMRGPNLGLYREARRRFPALSWQASGGVRNAADLAELDRLGVAHAVVGRALIEGAVTLTEVSPYLPGA